MQRETLDPLFQERNLVIMRATSVLRGLMIPSTTSWFLVNSEVLFFVKKFSSNLCGFSYGLIMRVKAFSCIQQLPADLIKQIMFFDVFPRCLMPFYLQLLLLCSSVNHMFGKLSYVCVTYFHVCRCFVCVQMQFDFLDKPAQLYIHVVNSRDCKNSHSLSTGQLHLGRV